MNAPPLVRRARPLLGTLVEIGVDAVDALAAGFAALERVQACMSRFDAASDIGRFNALPAGEAIEVDAWTAEVLAVAARLQAVTRGRFDISLGSAPAGWHCDGRQLHKLAAAGRLDLGGIAKGHAVDRAVEALQAAGAARGWVNAGGDLRAFGDIELPIRLRDETSGGVREFGRLRDGALATSRFDGDARSRLIAPADGAGIATNDDRRASATLHLSVAAPQCLWADALTKVVALMTASSEAEGRDDRPALIEGGEGLQRLLAEHGAQAWLH